MCRTVGNENCVIWPSSADRLLSPFSSAPSPSPLLFISPSSRLWSGQHVARGGRKDGSSDLCKSLPPREPSLDARPHGPLTCCLRDLWRLEAPGHCRLLSPLSPSFPYTHAAGSQVGATRTAPPSPGGSEEEFLAYAGQRHGRTHRHVHRPRRRFPHRPTQN